MAAAARARERRREADVRGCPGRRLGPGAHAGCPLRAFPPPSGPGRAHETYWPDTTAPTVRRAADGATGPADAELWTA
ncbi:hypothetical protein ABZ700_28050, partial [Streptomyces diastaticus]|uniref:hypothetical protein n=1 Tax=Streptomyces diastaticus TaxID=1956 RepID=UPI0033D1238A